ncbi:MAG: outer membrane protein assembly factor BamD [Candidatus Latescibacteria bacterium]|nr:outer membrane protein assembly factor BamD [bacterium]MBD3423955.1 outer membrane protein assembly factor BamD [Candidatus Latescibacterota bacterium]
MKNHAESITALAIFLIIFISSCGGPYTARTVNQPSRKLAIADQLFSDGKYQDAALEYKDYLAVFAGDERNDYAQFQLAECYRKDEDYPLAAVEYRVLINDYGYSTYVDDAFYLEALCYFKQSRRVERDQTKTMEARNKLTRFLRFFPNSNRREEAQKLLARVDDKLAEKKFIGGKLYFDRDHYSAARVYFERTIDLYPQTVWAPRSKYYLGRILEKEGEADQAARMYREVITSEIDGIGEEREKAEKRFQRISGELSDER